MSARSSNDDAACMAAPPAIPERPADLSVELEPFSTNRMHRPGEWQSIRRSQGYELWFRAACMSVAYEKCGRSVRGPYALRITAPASLMDLGNLEKPIGDALQGGRGVENDRLAERIELVRDRARAGATVLVEVWGLCPTASPATAGSRSTAP